MPCVHSRGGVPSPLPCATQASGGGEGSGGTRKREALNTGWQEEAIVSSLLVAKRHVDLAKRSRCYLGPAHL